MAVFEIIPDRNVRAVDIRDTLIANGADWSNEEVKNANYLPNYFKKGANINMYSRYKPVYYDGIEIPDGYLEKIYYGIDIDQHSSPIRLYNKIKEGNKVFKYEPPYRMLRLGDFRGYYPKAVSPTVILPVETVNADYPVVFEVFTSPEGDAHSVGVKDVYPSDFLYNGVLIAKNNRFWMGTGTLDFKETALKPFQGKTVDVMPFLTTHEFKNEPPLSGQLFFPILTDTPIFECTIKEESGTSPVGDYVLSVVGIYSTIDNNLEVVVTIDALIDVEIPDIRYEARYANGNGIISGSFDGFYAEVGKYTKRKKHWTLLNQSMESKVIAWTDPAHRVEGGIIVPF